MAGLFSLIQDVVPSREVVPSCGGRFASQVVHVYPLSQVRLRFSGDLLVTAQSVDAYVRSFVLCCIIRLCPVLGPTVHLHGFMMPTAH